MCALLGISQTCGGGEGMKRIKQLTDTNRMPRVRIVTAKIQICQHEKCVLCLCACKSERKQRKIV